MTILLVDENLVTGAPTPTGGTVAGPGVSTQNAISLWDNITGTLLQNSPNTINPVTGQIALNSTVNVGMIIERLTAQDPSMIEFRNTAFIRGRVGYLDVINPAAPPGGLDFGQIGWSQTGGVIIAARGSSPGIGIGGIKLYTTDSAFTSMIERFRILDDTGETVISSNIFESLKVTTSAGGGGTQCLATFGGNITTGASARVRMGYFGATGLASNVLNAQIGAGINGDVLIVPRDNFQGGGIKLYSTNVGSNGHVRRMHIMDGPGVIAITNDGVVGTGQLAIGTQIAGAGIALTLDNALGGAIIGQTSGALKWAIDVVSNVVRIGSITALDDLAFTTFNTTRAQIDKDDGRFQFLNGIVTQRRVIADADYVPLKGDYRLAITSITAARTITFSNLEIAKGAPTQVREWKIIDESGLVSGTESITLATEGAQTIDGLASLVITAPRFNLSIYSNGTNLFTEGA